MTTKQPLTLFQILSAKYPGGTNEKVTEDDKVLIRAELIRDQTDNHLDQWSRRNYEQILDGDGSEALYYE